MVPPLAVWNARGHALLNPGEAISDGGSGASAVTGNCATQHQHRIRIIGGGVIVVTSVLMLIAPTIAIMIGSIVGAG